MLAGVGGGICGYLTGLASLVTYPALIAAGLSPVTANVSNTLGVLFIGIGSTISARGRLRELGLRRLGRDVAVALVGGGIGGGLLLLGGGIGGGLLLLGGDSGFEAVVPWLVLAASLMLAAQPRLTRVRGDVDMPRPYLFGLALTCLYGGYFGAGAGVLFLVVSLLTSTVGFERAMMLKSTLLAASNLAASLVFIAAAPVDWWAALAMGIGCLIGGRLGPRLQGLVPQKVLRAVITLAGIGLAIWLWSKS